MSTYYNIGYGRGKQSAQTNKTNKINDIINEERGLVKVNDYIVYISAKANFSDNRKGIWKVIAKNSNEVTLESIANSNKFKTLLTNVVDIKLIKELGLLDNKYITDASLREYNNLKKPNDTTWEKIENPGEYTSREEYSYSDEYKPTNAKEINVNNKINQVINSNSNAAKAGALVVAGSTLNGVLKEQIGKQLPRKYRGLVAHPLADVVVANVASFAVQNFARENYKARVATQAMMEAAMIEFMKSFNIEEIITEALSTVDLSQFTGPAE